MRTPRFLSYDEWRDAEIATRPPSMLVECPDCDGTGYTECCECGNERKCDDCDEAGKVLWGDLTESQQRQLLTASAYYAAVMHDANALAQWHGAEAVEVLNASGMAPFTRLRPRRTEFEQVRA